MTEVVWYKRYDELREQVEERKNQFREQCASRGIDEDFIAMTAYENIIAHAVQQMNSLEGLYLDIPRTKELRSEAFNNLAGFTGPDINMPAFIDKHRQDVVELQQRGASNEEIAAYNLSSAFLAIHWINEAFKVREYAAWVQVMIMFLRTKDTFDWPGTTALLERDETVRQALEHLPEDLEDLRGNTEPTVFPATMGITTQGELWNTLLQIDFPNPRHLQLMHIRDYHDWCETE